MRKLLSVALLSSALAYSLTGCSTLEGLNPFADSGPKMAELQPIETKLAARVVWQQSVGEPLADLRQSLGGATRAAGHLVQGLGRLAWLGVSGRGRAPALDACQAARIR